MSFGISLKCFFADGVEVKLEAGTNRIDVAE
jgi:hypothetical protein